MMKKHRKEGGKIHEYTAVGSPEAKEAMTKEETFKKGGRTKKYKTGGHVKGHEAKHHLGKAKRAAGGKTPFSHAEKVKTEATDAGKWGEKETEELKQKVYKAGGHVKSHLSKFHSNKAHKAHGG